MRAELWDGTGDLRPLGSPGSQAEPTLCFGCRRVCKAALGCPFLGRDGVRGPWPSCWGGGGDLCHAALGRREGDRRMPWAGCGKCIPNPIPLTWEGRGVFPPGQFCSPPCPMGLPWVSIVLADGSEQRLGLMEFPPGKARHGERVVPSATGGNPVPLHGEPLNSLQGGLRPPHTAEPPLGSLFPCPGGGILLPVQELKAAVAPLWCVAF